MATRSKDVAAASKTTRPLPSASNTSTNSSGTTTTAATTASTSVAVSTAVSTAGAASSSASSTAATTTTTTTVPSTIATAGPSMSSKTSRTTERSKTTTTTATTSTTSITATPSTSGSSTTSSSATANGVATSSAAGASSATTAAVSTGTTTSATVSTNSETAASTKLAPVATTASSSSSPSENVPPATQNDMSHCALCGGESSDVAEEMMLCLCCGCSFHARCANLPQTPEEGDTFCRWECFSTYRKNQGVEPKTPLGDFTKLAARVQSILGDTPRHSGPHMALSHGQAAASSRDKDHQLRLRERGKRNLQGSNGRSRSPSPYHAHEGNDRIPRGQQHSNGFGAEHKLAAEMDPRRPSPRGRSPGQLRQLGPPIDLTGEDVEPPLPRSPRTRPARGVAGRLAAGDSSFDEVDELRGKRQKYLPPDDPMLNGGRVSSSRRDSYPPPPSRRLHSPSGNGADGYPNEISPHYLGGEGIPPGMDGLKGDDSRQAFPPGLFDRRGVPPGAGGRGPRVSPGSTRIDDEISSRPSSGRSIRSGNGGARFSDRTDDYDGARGLPPGPPRSRPSSADHPVEGAGGRRGRAPPDALPPGRPMPGAMPPARYSIPWLNPAAFPAGLRERFNCKPDNVNGVFRIDLTPVFADKTMQLYQSEIDFFFRCFESADVSLVVKGMVSELNQYIWAWPFILESCGSETHFSFDHFQFRHNAGELPELEYIGELRLSMAAYNAYLERYLSGGMGNDVVVLEDHATKKPITLVAGENIIALNDLVIAEHCAQLYNDLIKSFQWDVFAGGIHCLLQYLPQANRHKRFSSPLLHFNFPGARGRLRDPGNGTTDTAYQVLTGSLELVIFERLEPKDRDTFLRVLHAAGYDASKKAMLLDSHLRVLRDTGFAWSTVLLKDGEFVHVNKGRLHFWRVVESESVRGPLVNAPCVFLSWEWVYQGVSQRGISTECWFAMKNASLCTGGWAFDPRRAIVEAAKCGVAIVRTGQFLNSLSGPGAPPVLRQLAFTGASPASIDRDVVSQRQEQMVLFLESILPCMDAIVEEEFELGLVKDDSDDFRKVFDDEVMWKVVDTALTTREPPKDADYECAICGLELANIYKQCLGCTVHARRRRPNAAYPVFRICLRCHAQPERHHFKPRALHGYYDRLCSSEGHTGLLPATRRYQAERSYFKCRCAPYVRCADCGGCESCCCLCHTLFQTRFRSTAPEHLDHLRTDVVDVIKWHKQQLQLTQQATPHLASGRAHHAR